MGLFDNAQLMQLLSACHSLEELSIAVTDPRPIDEAIFQQMECPLSHLGLYDVEVQDAHLHVIAHKWRDTLKTFIVTVSPYRADKCPFTAEGCVPLHGCTNNFLFL